MGRRESGRGRVGEKGRGEENLRELCVFNKIDALSDLVSYTLKGTGFGDSPGGSVFRFYLD